MDALSEKSDEERIEGCSGRFSEKSKSIGVSEMSRINVGDVCEEDVQSNGSSSNKSERRKFLCDRIENYGTSPVTRANMRVFEDDVEIYDDISRFSGAKMDRNFEDMKPQTGNGKGLERSGEQWDWKIKGRSQMESFQRDQRIDFDGLRYSTSKYLEEGPSNYQSPGSYGYGEPLKNRNELDGSDELGKLGENQAEILRKLDELKDKLSQSCGVADKPKDKFPLDRRMVPPDPYGYTEKLFPDSYSAMNRASVPYSFSDHHVARPLYANHCAQTSPFMDRHAMAGHGFYSPPHASGLQEFEDPLRSQMFRSGPYRGPASFQQKPPRVCFSGAYVDGNLNPMDAYESYPPNINHHLPSCSCFHCYNKYQVSPNTFGVKQFSDVKKYPAFYHHEYQNAFGAKLNAPTAFRSNISVSHTKWPSDLKTEASDFVCNRPARVLLTTSGRRCQPIAGGAPFLACQSCHQLLQLPKKVFLDGGLKKMRCGACSTLIFLTVDSKRLNVSVHAEANASNDKLSHRDNLKEGSSHTHGHLNRASTNSSSDDYNNSGYDFQSMDRELGAVSAGLGSSIKSADTRSPHSTFSSPSEKEKNLDILITTRKNLNSSEQPVKGKKSPSPAGSPLQDYCNSSNKNHVANNFEDGNRSGRSEREKLIPKKTISRQNSMKDASATEIEISSNEYSNTGTSLDSGEASREGDQMRANKAAESFFIGMIKKSIRDSNRSSHDAEQEKANVTVNGNLISDRLIKKAEKLAGPIHPGHYW